MSKLEFGQAVPERSGSEYYESLRKIGEEMLEAEKSGDEDRIHQIEEKIEHAIMEMPMDIAHLPEAEKEILREAVRLSKEKASGGVSPFLHQLAETLTKSVLTKKEPDIPAPDLESLGEEADYLTHQLHEKKKPIQ